MIGKNFFYKNKYHIGVVHVLSFHLSARSSSFFRAFFLHFYGKPFYGSPDIKSSPSMIWWFGVSLCRGEIRPPDSQITILSTSIPKYWWYHPMYNTMKTPPVSVFEKVFGGWSLLLLLLLLQTPLIPPSLGGAFKEKGGARYHERESMAPPWQLTHTR